MTFKDFLAGKKGWSHSAQEMGMWLGLLSLISWLISPIISAVLIVLLIVKTNDIKVLWMTDKYWLQREVDQSLAMIKKGANRRYTDDDLIRVPNIANSFWTEDARQDVLHPRKMRKLWALIACGLTYWIFRGVGFTGIWLPW